MSERVVAFMSDQGRSSMARAARILGFRPEQVRVLPSDERARLSPDILRRAEVAALDWGAGYGYPRTASVRSTSPVRLLVVPGSLLNELVRDAPRFGDVVRRTMAERVARK